MALKQRARKREDKQARRAAILSVTAGLLEADAYDEITMAQVARECGLAKGTLYLYFGSKEELFLGLLERELVEWFDTLIGELGHDSPSSATAFGRSFAASLQQRSTLCELLVILHTVLERNVELETAISFKTMVRDKLLHGGQALERLRPQLPPGSGPRTLLRIYALMIGLKQVAFPSPVIAEVLQRDDMAQLRLDFEHDLATAVADMLRGIERPANDRSTQGLVTENSCSGGASGPDSARRRK